MKNHKGWLLVGTIAMLSFFILIGCYKEPIPKDSHWTIKEGDVIQIQDRYLIVDKGSAEIRIREYIYER